jgi:TonB family protein
MPVRAATGGQQHQLAALPVVPQGPGIAGLPDEGLRSGGDKPGASTPPTHPVNFAPYMAELQRKIGQHWFPPRDTESRTIIVTFTVDAAGNMSNLTMSRGSGIAFADHAALAAVKDTFPFRPLPDGAPPQVDIEFTFDYNVFTGCPRTF